MIFPAAQNTMQAGAEWTGYVGNGVVFACAGHGARVWLKGGLVICSSVCYAKKEHARLHGAF